MNKEMFSKQLRKRLSALPQKDLEERINFYLEMIDERMAEGLSEEDAISALGSIDEIAKQIIADTSLVKIVRKKIRPQRRLSALEIVLLALGSPIWLSIIISALAIILSLYISFWAIIVSFWAAFVAVACFALCIIVFGAIIAVKSNLLKGIAIIISGLICVGLAILLYFICIVVTKGAVALTKKLVNWLKNRVLKKESV